MNPRKLRSLDYLFVLRPVILVPGWIFLLLGYYAGRSRWEEPASPWYPGARLLACLAVGTALVGAIYILNQICDRETDRLNRKLYLISEGRIPVGAAAAELLLLDAGALLAAWAFFSPAFGILAIVSVLAGIAYSVRPMRLKARAGWDIAANGIGFGGILYVMGWAAAAPLDPVVVLRALPYVLAVGAVHTNATILDAEGDRAAGDETIAVRLGIRGTLWLGTALAAGSLALALSVGDPLTAVWAGASTLAFGWAARAAEAGRSVTVNQLSGRAFVVLQSLRFPYFFLWLIVVYGAAKWYYRARFGIDYPSLKDTRDERRPDSEPALSG